MFVFVFVVAGLAKLSDATGTRSSLRMFGVAPELALRLWFLLPLTELLVAVLLIVDRTRRAGAVLGLILLGVFSVALQRQIRRGNGANCNCFGSLTSTRISPRLLWRNGVLAAAGVVVALTAGEFRWTSWTGELTETERNLAVLSCVALAVALVMGVVLQRLLAQHRELLASVRLVEELFDRSDGIRHVDQVPAPSPGLPIGLPAPSSLLATREGDDVDLASMFGDGPLLLVFVGGGCGACAELMPELERWGREEDWLGILTIAAGDPAVNASLLTDRPGVTALSDPTGGTSAAYLAQWTPGAVLVGGDGRIASKIFYGAEGIERLVRFAHTERQGLTAGHVGGSPAPGAAGSVVPGAVAPVVERWLQADAKADHVVLFWQETCGFCQRFAPELLAFELAPPVGAPGVVIVARQQPSHPFDSPVVLDEDGEITRAFGSPGTPSGVLVDADGRVLSEVVAGAPLLRQLLGIDDEFALRHVRVPDPRPKMVT